MDWYLLVPDERDVVEVAQYIREHFPFQGSDFYGMCMSRRRVGMLDLAELRPLYQTWLAQVKALGYIAGWQCEQDMWACEVCHGQFLRGPERPLPSWWLS